MKLVEKIEDKKLFVLREVATETAQVIETPSGETINLNEAVVRILNSLDELKGGLL